MKILIIGGTGLISVAITKILLERGNDVTLFNRGQSLLPAHPGAKVVNGDRTDYAAFEDQIAGLGFFDVVIDMVGYSPEDGDSVVRAFSGITGHFIFCSTVDVYRKPAQKYPVKENEPYGGLNSYSRNKIKIEETLLEAQKKGDFPLTIIRPAYTYGESRGPVHTFGGGTTFLDRIRKGKPVVVHGDGSSFWTACHRDDVARAFVAACYNPNCMSQIYHTPGEEWMTWNDYTLKVAEAIGAPEPRIVHIPTDILFKAAPKRAAIVMENFQFSNIFDTGAAHADLDFNYTVTWVEGVQRMVRWLDDHNRIENSDLDPFEDNLIAAWENLSTKMSKNLKEF
jgi:nucleoside-diphosphate-sugar epimerase